MGFSRAELASYRDATVPDFLPDGLRLLFVGINPGLWTAAAQAHFAYPGNRFYPALYQAGITAYRIDAAEGWSESDRAELSRRRLGITNLVHRATARAADLRREELRHGAEQLLSLVARTTPEVVAVVGITAYRIAFHKPDAAPGDQGEKLVDSALWMVPNPSGLNAHHQVESLAAWYRAAADAAGVPAARPIA